MEYIGNLVAVAVVSLWVTGCFFSGHERALLWAVPVGYGVGMALNKLI